MIDGKILILDDNESNIEIMTMYVESEFDNEILTGECSLDGMDLLAEHQDIALIISDFHMPGGDGGELFKWAKEHRPEIPFLLVCGESKEDIQALPQFQGLFKKSLKVEPLISKPFNKDQMITSIKGIMEGELVHIVPGYKKISIERFIMFGQIGVNAHLRMGDGKMIKVIKENQEISDDLIKNLRNKNVEYLFIEDDQYEKFMNDALKDVMDLLSKQKDGQKNIEIQIKSVENIHDALKNLGVSDRALELADQVIDSAMVVIKGNKGISKIISSLIKNKNYKYELSMLVCYVSVAIANETEYNTPQILKKLSQAGLLMDISLDNENLVKVVTQHSESFNLLGKSEKSLVIGHPRESVNMIKNMDDFNSDLENLILDHHERPLGKGFPKGKDEKSISPLSGVFNLAHEFSHRLLTYNINKTSLAEIQKYFQENYGGGSYGKALEGFSKAFDV